MATRKMTFTLPEEVAARFLRQVPARDRSRYVTEALTRSLSRRDEQLVRACDAANADPDVAALEREMELVTAEVLEPWDDSTPR